MWKGDSASARGMRSEIRNLLSEALSKKASRPSPEPAPEPMPELASGLANLEKYAPYAPFDPLRDQMGALAESVLTMAQCTRGSDEPLTGPAALRRVDDVAGTHFKQAIDAMSRKDKQRLNTLLHEGQEEKSGPFKPGFEAQRLMDSHKALVQKKIDDPEAFARLEQRNQIHKQLLTTLVTVSDASVADLPKPTTLLQRFRRQG